MILPEINAELSTPDPALFSEYVIFYFLSAVLSLNLPMLFPANLADVMSNSLHIKII